MSCLLLLKQTMPCAFALAFERAGSSIPARIAMMAMTTNNSIKVKASPRRRGATQKRFGMRESDLFIRVFFFERVIHHTERPCLLRPDISLSNENGYWEPIGSDGD